MAKRGRPPGFKMPDDHRRKIKQAMILSRLQDHIEGKCDLSATQVSAATTLLKKVLPDLQNIEQSGSTDVTMRTIVTGVPRHGRDDAAVREGGDALPSRFPDQPPSDVKH